ncbi:hypothetical protein RB195_001540 [Necator americanus]|uniref:Uncharacterized protein n=1 Tax=Necator americanus TaxID=51031 RepID=A0ABR1DFE5_NECAM
MLPISITVLYVIIIASASTQPDQELSRGRRSVAGLYLCGTYPFQFTSHFPCGPCINCGACTLSCTTSYYCRSFDVSLACVSGCCTTTKVVKTSSVVYYAPPPPPVIKTVSVVQRTCIGPCVNLQCPRGFVCGPANVCCSYPIGK